MFAEKQLQEWWSRRSAQQRTQLKQAAQQTQLEPATVDLLFTTGCPVGPIGTQWPATQDPQWDWTWPSNVRTFITAQ
ncbi:hypothetical protein MNAB215_2404 [Mycobacterium numidiamassiliense]|uniref:Uncharacterized protein n=1 Tax=Mycobacterium numidiamassiliense TaxID=1841861 RepID=A0A2U3P8Y1_9MYCO|nr:hypothetical protein MNAB215_2404 [Mycobacterium numidiamassiliense]